MRTSILFISVVCLAAFTSTVTAQSGGQPGVALSDGAPYAVLILETRDGEAYVSYVGWGSSYDEWLSSDLVGAAPGSYAVGDRVFSIWSGNGIPYRAQVTATDGDRYEVRYDDDSSTEWREWDQLFPVTINQAAIVSARPEDDPRFTDGEGPFRPGEIVGAFWDGDPWWYDAEVLERRADGSYRVRYLGDGTEEWISSSQIMSAADAPIERNYQRSALSNYSDRVSVTVDNPGFERRVVLFPDGARQQTNDTLTEALPRGTRIYRYNPQTSDQLGQLILRVE